MSFLARIRPVYLWLVIIIVVVLFLIPLLITLMTGLRFSPTEFWLFVGRWVIYGIPQWLWWWPLLVVGGIRLGLALLRHYESRVALPAAPVAQTESRLVYWQECLQTQNNKELNPLIMRHLSGLVVQIITQQERRTASEVWQGLRQRSLALPASILHSLNMRVGTKAKPVTKAQLHEIIAFFERYLHV